LLLASQCGTGQVRRHTLLCSHHANCSGTGDEPSPGLRCPTVLQGGCGEGLRGHAPTRAQRGCTLVPQVRAGAGVYDCSQPDPSPPHTLSSYLAVTTASRGASPHSLSLWQHFPASAFRPAFKGPFGHKRRGHDGYDDEEADPRGGGTSSTPEALYLKIDGVEAEASADYAKEDLWIM
jgi:hypothetical protein